MNYLPDAALFLLFFAGLPGLGLSLSSPRRPLLDFVFPPLGFLGVWATLFYLAGLVGWLKPLPFWIAAIAVLLGVIVWKRQQGLQNARRLLASLRALSPLERFLALYLVLTGAMLFVLSLVPPSSGDYDSLVYHLAVPAQWLRDARAREMAFDHHSYFPFVGEMLYALGLGVRNEVFAKLFHWAMGVFGALVLAGLGRRAGGKTAGLWAAVLFASLPMAQSEATTAYVDLTFSAFSWAAIALFCSAVFFERDAASRCLDWLGAGVFCGLCLGSKYFGWLVFGFLGLWALAGVVRKREKAAVLAWLALPALLLGGFWYARNALWTGNPVFPFAYGVFGGRGWTKEMATTYDASQAIYGFGRSPLDLLLLPWRLAMSPLNFNLQNGQSLPFWPLDASIPAKAGQTGLFEVPGLALSVFPGPILLALGVPAFVARNKGAFVGFLAWLFAFLWTFWALSSQQVRYLFPALGLLCVLGGWVLATRIARFRLASLVAGVGVFAWLLLSPGVTLWRAKGSFAVLAGSQTSEDYLRRTFAGYNAMSWINEHTPESSRVAVYGEPRDFYLQRSYFWADDPHNNLVDYAQVHTSGDLANALKSLGATHILLNREAGRNGGFGGSPPLFDQLVSSKRARLVYPSGDESGHGFEVYTLN